MRAGPDVVRCTMPVRPLLTVSMPYGSAFALAAVAPLRLADPRDVPPTERQTTGASR